MLALCTISLTTILFLFNSLSNIITISIVVLGLFIFGAIFAINSSLHSFLILYFTTSERASLDVGFYYMANAIGRLIGTFLSGLSYQAGGLTFCLLVAALLLSFCYLLTFILKRQYQTSIS